ncbi:VapE domain-containing protein [Siphonobacter sp. SORGH_AS_0500]|uniref:VapE domain-containing protein n=1 Tax=Siphonobacter sp. SORGH_AS_0500 TaxID=1864824 RepID=UPI0028627A4C|nr:VapE domain-containing protein [Siphonobacter sp. SORGH_AS_0500]MDR6193090.1 putative P-loop ATPase [Siphonobacter sp. SORGH_AS_0500]
MARTNAKSEGEQNPYQRLKQYLFDRYEIRLNVISNDLEARSKSGTSEYTVLNDNDLKCELYDKNFNGFEKRLEALLLSSQVERYDPITHYFESLPRWEQGDPDYIAKLCTYVKTPDPEWFTAMFRKWLVRAVACGIGASPFNKQCLTLVGSQNDGKTSFLRFLASGTLKSYYKENVDFENKDGRIALCRNFLINLDELATLSKTDINKAKSFFTDHIIRVRLPYAKRESDGIRRASFVASTNESEFLTDTTGNVRWLIFEVQGFIHNNGGPGGYQHDIDMDQVWSQAYGLLKSGFMYEMNREEIEQSEKVNRSFQRSNPETELITRYFVPEEKGHPEAEFLTSSEMMEKLSYLTAHSHKLNPVTFGRALAFLRFPQTTDRTNSIFPRKGYWVRQYTFRNN